MMKKVVKTISMFCCKNRKKMRQIWYQELLYLFCNLDCIHTSMCAMKRYIIKIIIRYYRNNDDDSYEKDSRGDGRKEKQMMCK